MRSFKELDRSRLAAVHFMVPRLAEKVNGSIYVVSKTHQLRDGRKRSRENRQDETDVAVDDLIRKDKIDYWILSSKPGSLFGY